MDMNCTELAKVAAELALGVLTGRERAEAVAHLAGCDACREDVRQLIETHEGLIEMLPPKEPPAGFETRVLDRLGLPAAAATAAPHRPVLPGPRGTEPRGSEPRGTEPPQQAAPQAPPGRRPAGPLAPPRRRAAGRRHPGASRSRRLFAAGAIAIAIAGAGLGGWGLGMGVGTASRPGPVSPQQVPLTSAAFLTATHQNVGEAYFYQGSTRWLYMTVELPAGNGKVKCEVVDADGKVSPVGSFWLTNGYGSWGSPASWVPGSVRAAKLVAPDGKVLATATF
jgi:hypothetical protein